jgi:hypothetical protein
LFFSIECEKAGGVRFSRKVWTLLLFVTLLGFQNCAPVSFDVDPAANLLKSGNNGGVYAGKPTETFYRFVADFTCEQKPAPSASVEINSFGVELRESKKLLCDASKQTLDPSLIDSSIYQNEIVGYLEGIFEGRSEVPNKIPSNLVEIWCKDRNDENGIETIVHFDRSTHLALNRIYYARPNSGGGFSQQSIPDFSVARVVSQSTVAIKDEKGFELTVHRDQPAAQLGLFKAELQATIDGAKVKRDTACRLGGTLDPSIWPSRQIVDMNILDFKTTPDMNAFVFSSNTVTGNADLYAGKVDGTLLSQIAPKMLSPGILDFSVSPDSKTIVYRGSQRRVDVNELFKVDLSGGGNSHLGEDLVLDSQADSSSTMLTDVMFVNNGQTLLYKDGAGNLNGSSALKLKSLSLYGGTPTVLNLPYADTFGVHAYRVSPQAGKIAYLEGSPYGLDLYSMDFDGSHVLKITPKTSDSSWQMNWYDPLILSESGRYVVVSSLDSGTERDVAVAVDGSGSLEMPVGWHWGFSNKTDAFAFLPFRVAEVSPGVSEQIKLESRIINLQTKTVTALPQLREAFFTADSENLVGNEVLSGGGLRTLIFSTTSQVRGELCSGVSGSLMKIVEVEPMRFIIVSYDGVHRILNVHLKVGTANCVRVNSLPIVDDRINLIRDVTVSPDKAKIMVSLEEAKNQYSFQLPGVGSQIFYIPLSGKPGLQVNTPVSANANISNAIFLKDSQSVLYLGDQVRLNERNAFIWKAPL